MCRPGMHRHDLPHRGAHRFGMRRLKLARAKACDLRGHLQVKPLARRIFPHRGVPRQLQALKIQQSLAFRACVRRACQGLELRAEFPAHLNASFFCCLLYTWHQRRNWGHRCCGLKILTANKYLIDGSARRRPSRPLRWTHPNCWAFSTSTRGGAEKPSQPSPSVHETAPRPRHFNEGTGGYPGHSVRMRLRAVLSSTSTKGPGVYPGHGLIFYQHLSSSQGSACERSERKGAIERKTTRKRTRYPSHQAKEGASNTDETQNERPLALASNNDSPIGRDIEMRPQAHDAPRCPRIGNAHIAHQNRVFLT